MCEPSENNNTFRYKLTFVRTTHTIRHKETKKFLMFEANKECTSKGNLKFYEKFNEKKNFP